MGGHTLLQGVFPTQGLSLGLKIAEEKGRQKGKCREGPVWTHPGSRGASILSPYVRVTGGNALLPLPAWSL